VLGDEFMLAVERQPVVFVDCRFDLVGVVPDIGKSSADG
jgi:hypothetical protein